MTETILVIAEERRGVLRKVTLELLGEGRRIADKVGGKLSAVLLGAGVSSLAETLSAWGAAKIFVADDPALALYTPEAYLAVLSDLLQREHPSLVLLGATAWVSYARVVRAEALTLRGREFVQAAQALGGRHARLILRHLLPNVLTPVIVIATLEVARMIILESALSFLGLGIPPPTPTWGGMLADGRIYLATAWWLATFPGLAIMLSVLGINLLGDWLRDTLDPRLQNI